MTTQTPGNAPDALPTSSPPWGRTTKVIVAVSALVLLALLLWRFQSLVAMLVIAAILTYILSPAIDFIERRTRLRRGLVIALIYLLLALAVVGGFLALGVVAFQQIGSLIEQTPRLIQNSATLIFDVLDRTEPIMLGSIVITADAIPWEQVTQQLLGLAQPLLSQSGTMVSRLATSTVRTVVNVLFIFIVSIYLVRDVNRLRNVIVRLAGQAGHHQDAEILLSKLGPIWGAYLRGQVVLAFVIFLVVWIGLSALGVQNSLALGLLAGLLEFIPNVGPVISAVVAVLVAFFQPTNYLGLPSWQLALIVLGLMILIQQLENNLLVPRIMGQALDLHPLVVIVGVLMGASLAGILGAVLAAPIIASLRLFGNYAWRKFFDLPPFPTEEAAPETTDAPAVASQPAPE